MRCYYTLMRFKDGFIGDINRGRYPAYYAHGYAVSDMIIPIQQIVDFVLHDPIAKEIHNAIIDEA